MKINVRLQFSSEGDSPLEVIGKVKEVGFAPVVGEYDFSVTVRDREHYREILEKLHESLRGSKVRYSLTTKRDGKAEPPPPQD